MKTIRTLVISPNAPDTNSVWLNKGTAKYFNNGEWTTIGSDAIIDELGEKVDSLDKEVGNLTSKVTLLETEVGKLQDITGINSLEASAELSTVITTVNDIIDVMRIAGILTN